MVDSESPPAFPTRFLKATVVALVGFLLLAAGFVWTSFVLLASTPRAALTPSLITLGGAVVFYLGIGAIKRIRREEKEWYHARGMKAPREKDAREADED